MSLVSINAMTCPGTPSGITQSKFLYVAVWKKKGLLWDKQRTALRLLGFFFKYLGWVKMKRIRNITIWKVSCHCVRNIPETLMQYTSKS